MAERGVSNTAVGAAICRIIEQYHPKERRLFNDPVAKHLVGALIQVMVQSAGMRTFIMNRTDAIMPGIYGAQICRTRYIDDTVTAEVSQGVNQLVILGAGFDTRAYRLPGIEDVQVFEIDLPKVQNDKKNKVQKALGNLPKNVIFIPIDFDQQTLEAVLAGTTFDMSKPAVFGWEGVTQYLTEESVRTTLSFIGKCSPGSSIIFTYVLKSIVEHHSTIPGIERMLETVANNQSPWIFGLDPANLQSYLQQFHLSLVEDVGNQDYQARYLLPLKRSLVVFEGERIARAIVLPS